MKYSINTDLGIQYQDIPPWRSYEVSAEGNTLEELLDECYISEIDQDGGELNTYHFTNGSNEAIKIIYNLIEQEIKRR